MAKDPAFLFYPGDYLRDTQTLSEKSQVAYDRIICEHMRNICISKQQLKFFTKRLNEEEIEELMFVLTEINGGYQIEWVAESIEKRRKYSESRRDNRKGEGKKDMKNISKTYDSHMENENEIEDVSKKEVEDSFELFWDHYHSTTGKPKTDRTPTLKYWKKLSAEERQKAHDMVDKYNFSVNDQRYIKKARTYLSDKNFNDEFNKKDSSFLLPSEGFVL